MLRRSIVAAVVAGLIFCGGAAAGEAVATPEATTQAKTFLKILEYGWEINSVLGVLAFSALFLLFYSIFTTRRSLAAPDELRQALLDDIASGDIEAAQKRAAASPTILGQVVLPGLKLHDKSLERIHLAVEGAGRRAINGLRQRVTYLANIGAICPMLGLLGTVIGMMNAFYAMGEAQREAAKSLVMSAHIGQAMSTTAVGLIVGIPAMAFYYLCMSRVNRVGDDVEGATEDIVGALGEMK